MKLDKWTVILIIAVIIIGIIVYIGIQNKWFVAKSPLDLKDGGGNVQTDSNGEISTQYTRIAQFAHENIGGWNLNLTDSSLWTEVVTQLYPLNDNELRIVVNEYERLYAPETLRSLLAGEWAGCWWAQSSYYATDPCYKLYEVKNRLNSLNA